MADLDSEIAAFEGMRAGLEARHMGQWVLVHDGKLEGTFRSFEEAAKHAATQFGRGPYLIRQVGVSSVALPASVMYRPIHA